MKSQKQGDPLILCLILLTTPWEYSTCAGVPQGLLLLWQLQEASGQVNLGYNFKFVHSIDFWKSNSNKCHKCWLLSIFSVSACDTPEKDIFCRGCYGSSKNIQSFTFWKLKLYFQSSCREENDQQEIITRKEIRGKGLRICWGCGRPSNWRLVRK